MEREMEAREKGGGGGVCVWIETKTSEKFRREEKKKFIFI